MKHAPVIVLIEAELSMRILICELLQSSGYTVLDTGSPGEAIQALIQTAKASR